MKKVECIIHNQKVAELYEALLDFDVWGVTEIPVKGCGRQKGYYEEDKFSNKKRKIRVLPFKKLEFVIKDKTVEPLIELILKNLRTDIMGDGKIFVYPCEDAIRISDGKRGTAAISK